MTRVSVIVPVYEQWHLVPVLLEALARQTLPASQWECILVDNGSRNLPGDAGLPDNVRLEQCSTPGSYAARNHGLERAVGGLLAGTPGQRLVYLLRNLVPPVRAAWFVVRRRGFGAGEKLLIYGVALRLWLVGIAEVAAVLAGRTPERR